MLPLPMVQKVTFDHQSYLAPSWNEMGKLCFKLARQILKRRLNFDRLIALAKGGLTWSRTLADYLDIKKISVTHIRFYDGIGKTQTQPVIVQSLPVSVEGEKVLLFDDVADTGKTLGVAHDYLKMCGAKEVITATLFTKPWSIFKPDFTAETTDAWIIFPHEVREMVSHIAKKWAKKYSKKTMISHFLKLGLDRKQVEYFLK